MLNVLSFCLICACKSTIRHGQSNINEIYFKKLFPEVSRIVDLHAQIKQKLSTLSIKEQSDDDLLAKIQSDNSNQHLKG
jgi:type II secretory pathway component PulL